MYIYDPQKSLNDTLAVDSPFQTLAVDFSSNLTLPLRTPETLSSLSKSRISLFNAHPALFVKKMTQLRWHNPIGKYRHFSELALEVRALRSLLADHITSRELGKSENAGAPLEKKYVINQGRRKRYGHGRTNSEAKSGHGQH